MEFTQKQNILAIATLLFLAVITQAVYTGLYKFAGDIPRHWLWGLEGLIFVLLAAIAGSALVHAKTCTLGFSAIFASALLNLVQVGIGLTQFGPFREAAHPSLFTTLQRYCWGLLPFHSAQLSRGPALRGSVELPSF